MYSNKNKSMMLFQRKYPFGSPQNPIRGFNKIPVLKATGPIEMFTKLVFSKIVARNVILNN